MKLEDSDQHSTRGLIGLSILALPVLMTIVVVISYAVLFSLGWTGRSGTEQMTVSFTTCPAARAVLESRLADMGYTFDVVVRDDGVSYTFDGPTDPAVRASLPQDLARPGHFEVSGGGAPLASGAEITEASVRVDAMMVPTTLGHLTPEASARVSKWVRDNPRGSLDFYLDGERIGGQTNPAVTTGEFEIAPPIDDPMERLRATAGFAVLIDHPPLPCPVVPAGG